MDWIFSDVWTVSSIQDPSVFLLDGVPPINGGTIINDNTIRFQYAGTGFIGLPYDLAGRGAGFNADSEFNDWPQIGTVS